MRNLWRQDQITDVKEFEATFGSAANCSSCGVCEMFACPMGLSPRKMNDYTKGLLRGLGINPEKNQNPYTFSYGASTNVTLPWQMTLSTNITNQSRRGYDDASLNNNELIWNAQIAQSLLKGAATVSFEMYDILKQQSNISRSLTADVRSVTEYNSINSYCMVHFIYRLNIFGSKAARDKMMNSHRGFGGPGFGPGPGRHGRRPF